MALRSARIVYIVVCVLCIAQLSRAEVPVCRKVVQRPRGETPQPVAMTAGSYKLCIIDGNPSSSLNLGRCTAESFPLAAAGANTQFNCRLGNVDNKKAWLVTYKNARFLATKEADVITTTSSAAQMYANIGCAGYFSSLALNENIPPTTIENMFSKLANCHIQDSIRNAAQARGLTGVSLVSDLIGAIPHPAAIITGLVIKAVVAGINMQGDVKEDDWTKFLQVHFTIASIRVRCNAVTGPAVKTCLARANPNVNNGQQRVKFMFESCTGRTGGDDYLKLTSGGTVVLTTDAGPRVFGNGPLHNLCADNTPFQYISINMDASKRFCIQVWDRANMGADTKRGEQCASGPLRETNSITLQGSSGQFSLSFRIQRQ